MGGSVGNSNNPGGGFIRRARQELEETRKNGMMTMNEEERKLSIQSQNRAPHKSRTPLITRVSAPKKVRCACRQPRPPYFPRGELALRASVLPPTLGPAHHERSGVAAANLEVLKVSYAPLLFLG